MDFSSMALSMLLTVGGADELGVALIFSSIAMMLKLDFSPQQFNDITSVPHYRRVGRRIDLNFDIKRTTQVLNIFNCIKNQWRFGVKHFQKYNLSYF
jgi:hypothetical protein